METHLTIKHLAPYLPYGLRVKIKNDSDVLFTMLGLDLEDESISYGRNLWYESTSKIDCCKPILKPFSMLDGNKLEQSLMLGKNSKGKWCFYFDRIETWEIESCNTDIFQLLENHFDVFGLIEKGLAIDINTLPQSSE